MADSYLMVNGAAAGAAAPIVVTTGTAIKTMLQLASPSTRALRIIQWWVEFDGSVAATPIKVELVETTGAATVTAAVAADISRFGDPNAPAPLVTLGATATGYTASGEGTPGVSRIFAYHLVPPTGGIFVQYPLGREPELPISKFLRIRVTAAAAVNCITGVVWEE